MLYLASVLSVFLLAGIAPQAIGFYLTFLAVPFVLYWRKDLNPEIRGRMRQLSLGLFLLWGIFPLTSLYNYFMNDSVPIPMNVLLKSHFSSSLGITAAFFFLFSFKDWLRPKSSRSLPRLELEAPPITTFIRPFLKGLFFASLALCAYLLFQQVWGMDFMGKAIPVARRLPSGFYRVSGFYSHPLTLAGVGLTLFAFAASLFIQKEYVNKRSHLFGIMLTSAYMVFASGGRVASILVVVFAFVILVVNSLAPNRSRSQRSFKGILTKFFFFVVMLAVGFLIVDRMGLFSRFAALANMENNPEFERFIFWRVHWNIFLEHPLFGQGIALLNSFKRTEYYNLLGYASLENKYPAHNMFLEILSNVGILGTLVILFAVYKIWRAVQPSSYRNQIYMHALLIAFGLNLINGFTQNVFFDASVMYIYLSLIMLMVWGDINDSVKESPRHHQLTNRQSVVSPTKVNDY